MTLKEAVKVCLGKKYADFSTRASRKECGFFFLFYFILCMVLFMINIMVVMFEDSIEVYQLMVGLSVIIGLLLIVPSYAVCVRRLHDTGRRGWWVLLYFIPWIGTIALIIMLCQKSDEDNKYGPKP